MKPSSSRFDSVRLRNGWFSTSADAGLDERPLDLGVEDHAARRRQQALAAPLVLDRILVPDLTRLDVELDVLLGAEPAQALLAERLRELLGRRRQRGRAAQYVRKYAPSTMSWVGVASGRPLAGERMLFAESMSTRASACASAERGRCDGHLVAVEVGVERVADERVHLDRLALDEHRLERLDAEPVQRRSPVQEHRMLGDDLLEDVPDLGDHRLDHLLRRLDVLDGLALDEPAHDERLEELERHQLRQPALVELQVRAGDDHRAARVVDALAEQVLPEAALLALEHVGERLQRAVARAR